MRALPRAIIRPVEDRFLTSRPGGIAATLSDAVALASAFGAGTRIGLGTAADILAPSGLALAPTAADQALATNRPRYVFSFGNTASPLDCGALGPLIDRLAAASAADFICASFALPWFGRTVYQGHLFQEGAHRGDLKRELAPFIEGPIAVLPQEHVTEAGAIRARLTAMKERGIRLALLDAIDEAQCGIIAEALAPLPIIAGPAWLARDLAEQDEASPPGGPLAILSGALHRQSLIQTAAARAAMPVFDLDPDDPDGVADALAWARTRFGAPFLITSGAPPNRLRPDAPAAHALAAIAEALAGAGIRNFLLAGNDTAAAILARLGVTELTVGAPFAGLRWLRAGNLHFLIKPGGFGSRNLFLYDFEPQSRLNEPAE